MKVKEILKSIALALLLMLTAVLTVSLWSLSAYQDGARNGPLGGAQSFFSSIGLSSVFGWLGGDEAEQPIFLADTRYVSPMSAAVAVGESVYSPAGRDEVTAKIFDEVRKTLAGVPHSPTQAAAQEWAAALLGDFLLLDFGRELPLSVMTVLTGGEYEAEQQVYFRWLLVSVDEGRALFKAAGGGVHAMQLGDEAVRTLRYYISNSDWDSLGERVSLVARLERGDTLYPVMSRIPPELVICEGERRMQRLACYSSLSRAHLMDVLDRFDYSLSLQSYFGDAGEQVYVHNFGTLSIAPDGLLKYNASPQARGLEVSSLLGGEQRERYTGGELAAAGGLFMQRFDEGILGGPAGKLALTSVQYDQGIFTVTFAYFAGGAAVSGMLDGGTDAVRLHFSGGRLFSAEIYFVSFENWDEERVLMSQERQLYMMMTRIGAPASIAGMDILYTPAADVEGVSGEGAEGIRLFEPGYAFF